MDQFTADYLANLTADLTAQILNAAGRRAREALSGTERQRAMAGCVQAGLVALLATANAPAGDEAQLLADIFRRFFTDPAVGGELSRLARGSTPDADELMRLFEDAGFDAETLPGLNFRVGLAAFEVAFLSAAEGEPALQGLIQTHQSLAQTALQREMVTVIRRLPEFLRDARPGSVGIQADRIIAENVVNGVQIIYQWPGQAPPPPAGDALAAYRRVVANTFAHLPLRGLDKSASDPTATQKPIRLANVYIDLNTTTQVPVSQADIDKKKPKVTLEKERPLGALEVVVANRRVVLTGDPGGGKSTFVSHLAYCLTAGAVEPGVDWLSHLPGWPAPESGALPLVVILRDFARSLPSPLPRRAEPTHLWDFIEAWLQAKDLAEAVGALRHALGHGQALILLDGLDEVPSVEQRMFVRDAVTAFVERHPADNRYLATCRTLSYLPPASDDKPDLRLPGFATFELAKFDPKQIDRFIAAWYAELSRLGTVRSDDTSDLIAQLRQAVKRPDLWRLAPNPLLLTVMALVHAHKGRLPDARARLYEDAIEYLLWRWEQVKPGAQADTPVLLQLLMDAGRTDVDLKRVLSQLAFEVHARVGDGDDREKLADIDQMALIRSLAALNHDDYNWAHRITEMMKLRAGLLLERDIGVFTFPHRTFQEYLAGTHLAAQNDFALKACQLAERGAMWREPILLAVGRLVYLSGETARPLALVAELCPAQAGDDVAWRKAWLAGDALLEIGTNRVNDSELGRDLLERVRHRLKDLVTGGKLSPRERVEAGNTLARLGDPRPDVMAVSAMPFCYVPPGPFIMGEGKDEEHSNKHLDYGYWIGRYPVPNAQYREFVEAGGYREADYWPEAQSHGWWSAGQFKGRFDDEPRERPYDHGEPFNLPNHPVVGVSWYEALAFTRWLTDGWRREGRLPSGLQVRLPSEAEWEKAARGGIEIPAQPLARSDRWDIGTPSLTKNPEPKRRYPWGDQPDPARANYDDTGVGATSAVGCFPAGSTPYGCEDMSGNVWEWTRSIYRKYPYDPKDGREEAGSNDDRVLRGGAFFDEARFVRCAYRFRLYPGLRHFDGGFRVVLSPL